MSVDTGSLYMDLGNALQVKNAIKKTVNSFNTFIEALRQAQEQVYEFFNSSKQKEVVKIIYYFFCFDYLYKLRDKAMTESC